MTREEFIKFLEGNHVTTKTASSFYPTDKLVVLSEVVACVADAFNEHEFVKNNLDNTNHHMLGLTRDLATLKTELNTALKDRDRHKRVRKALTRQLKDVEKARKQEFDMFLSQASKKDKLIEQLHVRVKELEVNKAKSTFTPTSFYEKVMSFRKSIGLE